MMWCVTNWEPRSEQQPIAAARSSCCRRRYGLPLIVLRRSPHAAAQQWRLCGVNYRSSLIMRRFFLSSFDQGLYY